MLELTQLKRYRMKPNTQFTLDVRDLNLIENALRLYAQHNDKELPNVTNLLAKFHDQKNWYYPPGKLYVSG